MKRVIAIGCAWFGLLLAPCGILSLGIAHAQGHEEHAREQQHFEHEHYDARFHHDRSYPARGVEVGVLPHEHVEVIRGGAHYYYAGGVWYAPHGPRFVVIAPPIGVFVPVLPTFYTTVWLGAVPYYYANDAYYMYRGPSQGYEVVDPPAEGAVSTQAPPGGPPPGEAPPTGPPSADNLFIYPRDGQSPDQQSRDRYDCHTWASSQTGFDPTVGGGGVAAPQIDSKRVEYNRAMSACLEARGYTVK
ncbi:MAG TPA: DUF6515 family protein [Steroidobacteraceae bacterium]|nr:DUF6515 family protein [Steroidobacteraceae bacterium]